MRRVLILGAMAALMIMLFSCATGAPAGPTPTPLYYGTGSGSSGLAAMNDAKGDAVRQAANDLLGVAVVLAKAPELDAFFGEIKDYNIYVLPETAQTLAADQSAYRLSVRVNLQALGRSLSAKMLLGGQVAGSAGETYALPDKAPPAGIAAQPAAPAPETTKDHPGGANKDDVIQNPPATKDDVIQNPPATKDDVAAAPAQTTPPPTPEERAFIDGYMSDLTYMVYYDEDSQAEPFLVKAAVVSANKYLNQNNMNYVDLEQIESLRKDQELVYEEETGQSVSIIQWIAHKLNADVYIEINLNANGRSDGNRHYGSATVTLNNYEASSAEGRGAASYQTNPPAFSTVSQSDALNNAVTSAIYQAMPEALSTASRETREALTRGLKYSLTILNTTDSRLMRNFERKLERKVRSMRKLSFSPEQTVYEIYLLGEIFDLEDAIYDVADTMPDLEGITLVMQQRSALTFDSGL